MQILQFLFWIKIIMDLYICMSAQAISQIGMWLFLWLIIFCTFPLIFFWLVSQTY